MDEIKEIEVEDVVRSRDKLAENLKVAHNHMMEYEMFLKGIYDHSFETSPSIVQEDIKEIKAGIFELLNRA